jgi:hypothetical protein
MPSRCTTSADSFIRPGRTGPRTPAMALTGYGFRDGMDAADGTSRNRDQISCRHSRRQPAALRPGAPPICSPSVAWHTEAMRGHA